MSLAQRSIMSTAWNIAASWVSLGVLFMRSVLLARLLPVNVFGIYTGAGAIVGLTAVVAHFGLGGAFLHRSPETEDEEQAAAVHFTLTLIFTVAWAALLLAGAWLYTSGPTRTALLVSTLTTGGITLAYTPRLILVRRVVHRRLALLKALNVLLTTVVALGLAWRGATLWALLATDIVSLVLAIIVLYVWRPVWRVRLAWSPTGVRYYMQFGSRNFVSDVLLRALDKVDDLWTGVYLGATALGYYSRAYTFATYPRRILAEPVSIVAEGTYAELKENRQHLSQAFFRTNALLVRSGFFFAGCLALIAPEFTRIVLGPKWLPMLDAFRLMLVFTLLDPIKTTVAGLFIAVGVPEQVVRARFVQLVVLTAGLFLLGPPLGITGVALAVDIMLVVGIVILLLRARRYVDFSLVRLFVAPGLALLVGLLLARAAITLPGVLGSDWRTAFVKLAVFSTTFGIVLLISERQQFSEMFTMLYKQIFCQLKTE
jgi:O-antigen/teichoic acid export membrane protein